MWQVSVTISYACNSINKKTCKSQTYVNRLNAFGQVQEGSYLDSLSESDN